MTVCPPGDFIFLHKLFSDATSTYEWTKERDIKDDPLRRPSLALHLILIIAVHGSYDSCSFNADLALVHGFMELCRLQSLAFPLILLNCIFLYLPRLYATPYHINIKQNIQEGRKEHTEVSLFELSQRFCKEQERTTVI